MLRKNLKWIKKIKNIINFINEQINHIPKFEAISYGGEPLLKMNTIETLYFAKICDYYDPY